MSDDLFKTLFGITTRATSSTETVEADKAEGGGEGDVQAAKQSEERSQGSQERKDLFPTVRGVRKESHADAGDGGGLLPVSTVLVRTDQSDEVQPVLDGSGGDEREADEAEVSNDGRVVDGELEWFPGSTDGEKKLISVAMENAPWVKRETSTMEWKFDWAPGITEEQKTWSASQLESAIPRMGAKSKLRDWLVGKFPKHHSYIEPFGGSFKVILWKRNISKIEIINDADSEVIHFFRHLTFFPEELAKMINDVPLSQELMKLFRNQLNKDELTGLQRAAAFYVVTKMTFNGTGMGFAGSVQSPMNIAVDTSLFKSIASRLKKVDIRNDNAFHLIKVCNKDLDDSKYPGGVFFYLDPPYDKTYGYKSTNGKELGFGWAEQQKLYKDCCSIDDNGNKFIQTNSATDRLYELYGERFTCINREVEYTVSSKAENRGKNNELIIANFDITKEVRGNIGGMFG